MFDQHILTITAQFEVLQLWQQTYIMLNSTYFFLVFFFLHINKICWKTDCSSKRIGSLLIFFGEIKAIRFKLLSYLCSISLYIYTMNVFRWFCNLNAINHLFFFFFYIFYMLQIIYALSCIQAEFLIIYQIFISKFQKEKKMLISR